LLATVLNAVSETGEEQPLTVFCGGVAVSGIAVPDDVYFRRIGLDTLEDDTPQSRQELVQETARINAELDRDDISPEELQSLRERAYNLKRQFIVMVDVTILGTGPTPIRAQAWRGRLSQVSGWVLGTVGERDDPLPPTEADQAGIRR